TCEYSFPAGRISFAGLAEVHGIQRGIAGGRGLFGNAFGSIPKIAGDGGVCEEVRGAQLPAERETAGCADDDLCGMGRDCEPAADGDRGLEGSTNVERVRD